MMLSEGAAQNEAMIMYAWPALIDSEVPGMVTCSKCGKDNQPTSVYCDNCGIPVHREQGESLHAGHRSRYIFIGGIFAGIFLVGLGIVIGMFSAEVGMSGSEYIGYALLVIGIIVLGISALMFGRIKA